MLPSWCQDTVTVLRAPVVVRNGREHRDWTQAESHDLTGCSLQPSSTETGFDGARRDASASAARLLCPPGSDIQGARPRGRGVAHVGGGRRAAGRIQPDGPRVQPVRDAARVEGVSAWPRSPWS